MGALKGTMRLVVRMLCAAAVLCGCAAPAAPPESADPFTRFGKLASQTTAVRIDLTLAFTEHKGGGNSFISLYGDSTAGRYFFSAISVVVGKQDTEGKMECALCTAERCVTWVMRDGRAGRVFEIPRPEQADVPLYASSSPFLAVFFDGLNGYRFMGRQIALVPETPEGHEKDGLEWFRAEKAATGSPRFQNEIGWRECRFWFGFSPKDGWIHSAVVQNSKEKMNGEIKVSRIDRKPDLRGVFDLPADVRALLEKKKTQGDRPGR